MADILIYPPHLRLAQEELAAAGIDVEAGKAALKLAATIYNRMPVVSKTDALRKERNTTQGELEEISYQLLQERKKTQQLQQQLSALNAEPIEDWVITKQIMKRFRQIKEALIHGTWSPEQKIAEAQRFVDKALLRVLDDDIKNNATGEPMIVIQTQIVEKVKRVKVQAKATSALESNQRQRIAELEKTLYERVTLGKLGNRFVKQVFELVDFPDHQVEAAMQENPLLHALLKKWKTLSGTIEAMQDAREAPSS